MLSILLWITPIIFDNTTYNNWKVLESSYESITRIKFKCTNTLRACAYLYFSIGKEKTNAWDFYSTYFKNTHGRPTYRQVGWLSHHHRKLARNISGNTYSLEHKSWKSHGFYFILFNLFRGWLIWKRIRAFNATFVLRTYIFIFVRLHLSLNSNLKRLAQVQKI